MAKDQLVSVEAMQRVDDDYGGYEETWSEVGKLWVEIRRVQAREMESQGATRGHSVYVLTADTMDVRAVALDHTMRLKWEGKTMDVREVPDLGARSVDTEFVAESGRVFDA